MKGEMLALSQAHGLMFHHFHGAGHPRGQGSISSDEFAEMLEFVGRDRILPAEEWLDRALKGSLQAADLCLTFDDSLRCQFDVAYPVMKALGLTGFWFVYTSVMEGNIEPLEIYRHYRHSHFFKDVDEFYEAFHKSIAASDERVGVAAALRKFDPDEYLKDYVFYTPTDRRFKFVRDEILGPDRYKAVMDRMMTASGFDVAEAAKGLWMDDDCLRRLRADGHVIGLHSHSHPTRLADLSEERQKLEYRSNMDHLRRVLSEPPLTVSHPCNSYGPETLRLLSGMGIRHGFCATMSDVPPPSQLEHPRVDHADILRMIRAR